MAFNIQICLMLDDLRGTPILGNPHFLPHYVSDHGDRIAQFMEFFYWDMGWNGDYIPLKEPTRNWCQLDGTFSGWWFFLPL